MPVAIPQPVRLGFLKYFRLARQWPYHGLTDRVRGIVTDILCRKSDRKKPGQWDRGGMATDVKKPGLWDRGMVTGRWGEKHERRCPLSVKTSPYWQMTDGGIKIVAFQIAAYDGVKWKGENLGFFLDVSIRLTPTSRKKLNSSPSISRYRICGDLEGNNFNASVRRSSIREVFMDAGRRCSGFWPGPTVTIPRSPKPGFFNISGHTMVSQNGVFLIFFYHFFDLGRQWSYNGPGLWDCGMVIDVPV